MRCKSASRAAFFWRPGGGKPGLARDRAPGMLGLGLPGEINELFWWLRRPRGSAPWTPDGVPPPAYSLRGGSLPYGLARRGFSGALAADARLGTDKMGSGAYWPQPGQGQSPISANIRKSELWQQEAEGLIRKVKARALPWTRWGRRPQTPFCLYPRLALTPSQSAGVRGLRDWYRRLPPRSATQAAARRRGAGGQSPLVGEANKTQPVDFVL